MKEYPAWLNKDGTRRHDAKAKPHGITDQMLEWHATIRLAEVSRLHSAPVKGLGMLRYWVDIESEYWGCGCSKSQSYEQAVQYVNDFMRYHKIPNDHMHWHNHTPDSVAEQYLFTNYEMEAGNE